VRPLRRRAVRGCVCSSCVGAAAQDLREKCCSVALRGEYLHMHWQHAAQLAVLHIEYYNATMRSQVSQQLVTYAQQ
jgi:hypothetical protein